MILFRGGVQKMVIKVKDRREALGLSQAELARMAGVDIATDAPLLDTIETIGGYIDEIVRLTEELSL